MPARADLISVVEACYDLGASDTEWLGNVARTFQDVLRADDGLLAYHIDVDEHGFKARTPVQIGGSKDLVERIQTLSVLIDSRNRAQAGLIDRAKAAIVERVVRRCFEEPADSMLFSEHRRLGPDWVYTLGAPIEDTFTLLNHHVDGNGLTGLFGGLGEKRTFRSAERAMFQMISAHIKAGLRLRRRLPAQDDGVDAPSGGAVLSASGRVLHAEGEATDDEAVEELGACARHIERARSQKSGRDEHALAVWQGLIRGRWSLVESFDVDGKRFLLAHRNPEDVRDPRGLTSMETRVVGLACRGYSHALIAYHLGLAEGTVSSHLFRAMRKLGIANRVELVRRLGPCYPQKLP